MLSRCAENRDVKRLCKNRQPLDGPANHPIEPRQRASAVAILKAVGSGIHSVVAISECFRTIIELILAVMLESRALSLSWRIEMRIGKLGAEAVPDWKSNGGQSVQAMFISKRRPSRCGGVPGLENLRKESHDRNVDVDCSVRLFVALGHVRRTEYLPLAERSDGIGCAWRLGDDGGEQYRYRYRGLRISL